MAVAAVVTGAFSPLYAGLEFVLYGAGGAAIGLLAGLVISRVRQQIEDPLVEITITLVTPYAAYIPAKEPFWQWGAKEVAIDAFHHLVYASATGVAYAALDR